MRTTASHSLYQDFKGLQLESLADVYAHQERLRNEQHEEIGVAPFRSTRRGDDTPISETVWAPAGEILLPKADVIRFAREDRDIEVVTWQGAQSVVGNLMEPLDMYPPRYRVRSFPSEEQLAWMAREHSAE